MHVLDTSLFMPSLVPTPLFPPSFHLLLRKEGIKDEQDGREGRKKGWMNGWQMKEGWMKEGWRKEGWMEEGLHEGRTI